MTGYGAEVVERLRARLEPLRDDSAAAPMAKYMRDQFAFLGLPMPVRRVEYRAALHDMEPPSEGELRDAVLGLWALPEREYQYCGVELAARWIGRCGPDFIATLRELITTKSWWDTVDTLAAKCVGPLAAAHAGLSQTLDEWISGDEMWLQRTAILHQLGYKANTDRDRLARYCLLRADEREFFIRKAIGWALREYSKTNGAWVRWFVAEHEGVLSPLSKREALLWLDGGRSEAGLRSPGR